MLYYTIQGDYTIRVELKDNQANSQLMCMEVNAKLVKQGSGGFIFGRRDV